MIQPLIFCRFVWPFMLLGKGEFVSAITQKRHYDF